MKKELALTLLFTLMLSATGFALSSANPIHATVHPIYIRSDGSVDPPDSPLKNVGGNRYVLTDNLHSNATSLFEMSMYSIIIEKDNIVLDGCNYTMAGAEGQGIKVVQRNNVTIQNIVLRYFYAAIELYQSSKVTITGASISSCDYALEITNSSNLVINGNFLSDDCQQTTVTMRYTNSTVLYGNQFSRSPAAFASLVDGLRLEGCSNNIIAANNITNFNSGVTLINSSNNYFYQNNFVGNNISAYDQVTTKLYQNLNNSNTRINSLNLPNMHYAPFYYSVNAWRSNYWDSDSDRQAAHVIDERNVDNSPLAQAITSQQVAPLNSINFTIIHSQASNETDYSNQSIGNKYLYEIVASGIIAVVAFGIVGFLYKRRKNGNLKAIQNKQT